MTIRCKKRRPLSREEGKLRDCRLFVIATEDTVAPVRYFRLFESQRIHVHLLPTEAGLSAPDHVLRRLDQYRSEYDSDGDDEFWLVLDTDHWTGRSHVRNFKRVCSEAKKKGYKLGHGNPCFELWLLLHLEDAKPGNEFRACEAVKNRIRKILGEYTGNTIDSTRFPPELRRQAIVRARALDRQPREPWPSTNGSRVYRLAQRLFELL